LATTQFGELLEKYFQIDPGFTQNIQAHEAGSASLAKVLKIMLNLSRRRSEKTNIIGGRDV